jgi:hypothetical protein
LPARAVLRLKSRLDCRDIALWRAAPRPPPCARIAVKSDKSRGCHFARASWFFRRFSRRFPPLAHAHGDEVLKWCFRAASRAVSKL